MAMLGNLFFAMNDRGHGVVRVENNKNPKVKYLLEH